MRTWGFDYARYLAGEWDVLAALLLPLAALLPPVRRALGRQLTQPSFKSFPKRSGLAFAVLAAALSAFLVIQYRVPYAFLGDGAYYAGEMYRVISTPEYAPAFLKPTSWLTGQILLALGQWLKPEDTGLPFAILGAACAASLVLSLFVFASREKKPVASALAVAGLTGAGSLLFFGYIELYAPVYLFTIAYFMSSWASLRQGLSVAVPGILLIAAIACGAAALFFVPSYLLLLHWRFRGSEGRFPLRRAAALLVALLIAGIAGAYAVLGIDKADGALVPLYLDAASPAVFTLLSPARLADVANLLLLNCGAWLFVLAALTARSGRGMPWRDPLLLFAVTAAAGGFLFILVGNAALGAARDWDLAAAPVFAVGFLALSMLVLLHERGSLSMAGVLPVILLAGATSLYAWLRVNIDNPRDGEAVSALRLYDISVMDRSFVLPVHTFTALENLRGYYHSTGDNKRELALLRESVSTRHLLRDTFDKLITATAVPGSAQDRREGFKTLFAMIEDEAGRSADPGWGEGASLRELTARAALAAIQSGETREAATALERFRSLYPNWREAAIVEIFLTPGSTAVEMKKAAASAVDSTTMDASLLAASARVHAQAGDAAAAVRLFELAIDREPGRYPSLYIELAGIAYEALGDREKAVEALNRCIREARGTPEAGDARQILQRI